MFMIDTVAAKESGKKLIKFPDVNNNYRPMFYLEDGADLILRTGTGELITRPCKYIDSHHFYFGSNCFHIDQFAELNQRNNNVCTPAQPITDLSVYERFYADRSFTGKNGKPIPYRALLGYEPDRSGRPSVVLCICPEAPVDRQVCLHKRIDEQGEITVEKQFCSLTDAMRNILPELPLSSYESKAVCSVFEQQQNLMERKPPLDIQISGAAERRTSGQAAQERQAPQR